MTAVYICDRINWAQNVDIPIYDQNMPKIAKIEGSEAKTEESFKKSSSPLNDLEGQGKVTS